MLKLSELMQLLQQLLLTDLCAFFKMCNVTILKTLNGKINTKDDN